jgi:two-component system sensor histidine kinase/response regulator
MNNISSVKHKLNSIWLTITGLPEHFILRARIFHSVCFIAGLALLYNVPFNYAIGLPKIALESLFLLVVVGLLYYNSRVKNNVSTSICLALLAVHVTFAINYFINSGVNGPTDVFLLLSIIVIIAIAPVRHYKFWIPLNLVLGMGLNLTEYLWPELVPFTYTNRFNQFIDLSSANLVVVLVSFYCITYIRRQYEIEKKSAEAKSNAIEEQNVRILKQNLELQRLNAEKNKLMSIIAHDLRSPLGSIQNSLEIITEYDLESEDKQYIERELLQTTKKTSAMLSKLLSWSKSQITGISVFPASHNLAELLENTLETEKSIAAQKKIDLYSRIDPEISIYADGDMMELIVRNLVGNAIKFTQSGGSIFIETQKNENECWLFIRDTGTGIPTDKQGEIFSLTAKSTYGTENEKGLGLGLLLCKEFIVAQGGNIWFESAPGAGTIFYISIPLFEAEKSDVAPLLLKGANHLEEDFS